MHTENTWAVKGAPEEAVYVPWDAFEALPWIHLPFRQFLSFHSEPITHQWLFICKLSFQGTKSSDNFLSFLSLQGIRSGMFYFNEGCGDYFF